MTQNTRHTLFVAVAAAGGDFLETAVDLIGSFPAPA
jgi:hypothetical protein